MINDELKQESNDSYFTLDHIIFLCNKYRSRILKQLYEAKTYMKIGRQSLQTITVPLEKSARIIDTQRLLKSLQPIPDLITDCRMSVNIQDLYNSIYISVVPYERMKFTGITKWERNIIYCSIAPDDFLYMKSSNSQFLALKTVNVTALFSDCDEVVKRNNPNSDIMDMVYPIEDYLVPQLVLLVVKELSGAMYTPEDDVNNAADDKSNMENMIRRNMKKKKKTDTDDDDE